MKDDVEGPTKSSAAGKRSSVASNEPPKLGTGIKIAGLCTVLLTVGLAVPLVFVRKRAAALAVESSSSIPIYRTGPSPSALLRAHPPSPASSALRPLKTPQLPITKPKSSPKELDAPVNITLQAMKHGLAALSIATGIVSVTAGSSYYAFKWVTGIRDFHEFSQFMRGVIANTVPAHFNSRLHAPDPSPPDTSTEADATIDEVERRLQLAYDEGGIVKWGEQALVEFEREWSEK